MPVLKKGEDTTYQDAYRNTVDRLRIENDAFFGVDTYRYFDEEVGRDVWVCDASMVDETNPPKSHDAPSIQKNNALLRCLARLRAIDYAISESKNPSLDVKRTGIRNAIQERFTQLETALNKKKRSGNDCLKAEKGFNDFLIKQLYEANLTEGCLTEGDAEHLLAHYRVLSSVLDPAMPLVTLTYDKDSKIQQREIQYPVTTKTGKQKEEIIAYQAQGVVVNPSDAEKNASTVSNLATQRADACFWDMLADDKRMLPAQARKTHLVGSKNAFIVHVQTDFGDWTPEDSEAFKRNPLEKGISANNLRLARMGVPVFVGKGETDSQAHAHTAENLEQIQMAAREVMGDAAPTAIHLTVLNTDSSGEKQDVMLSHLRHEIANKDDNNHEMSNVPTNDYGTAFFPVSLNLNIYNAFKAREGQERFWWTLGQKANRLKIAVDTVFSAVHVGYLSCVNCASGQDRTGTVIEKVIQEATLEQWINFIWETEKRVPNDTEKAQKIELIQAMRARGFNAAEVASHMVPGSPGMKPCSKANNWFDSVRTFGEVAEKAFYLKSADTNKENKVGNVDFLRKPPEVALDEFNRRKRQFEYALLSLKDEGLSGELKERGRALLLEFGELEALQVNATLLEKANKMRREFEEGLVGVSGKRNTRDLAYMTATLQYATDVAEGLQSGGVAGLNKAEKAITRLYAMEEVLPGYKSLKMRIGAFSIIATVVLIAIVMFAYPPFGVAVLATATMIGGLSQAIIAAAAMSGFGVMSYGVWGSLSSAWELWHGSHAKGKAKVVGDFRAVGEQKMEPAEKQLDKKDNENDVKKKEDDAKDDEYLDLLYPRKR